MPLLLRCTCGKPLRVRDESAGKKVRCPGCQALLAVPAAGPAEAPVRRPPDPARPSRRAPEPEDDDYDEAPRPRARRKPPGRQLVLRILVLVFGLPGAGLAGFLGLKAYSNTHDPEQIQSVEMQRALVEVGDKANAASPHMETMRNEVKRFDQLKVVCYLLLAGSVLGLAGAVLAFLRWGKIAAPLLILPAVGAAVIAPISAVLTSPLMLAGLLAVFIKRPRRPAPEPVAQGAW